MPVTQLITTLPYTPEVLYTLPQSLGILNSYSPSESCNAAKKKKNARTLREKKHHNFKQFSGYE